MAQTPRPSLSITLPTNFEFHYNDGNLPRTPEQQQDEVQTPLNPPPPPRPQTFKVKRRRAAIPEQFQESLSDVPIPTIEMSEAIEPMSSPFLQPQAASEGLLAPMMPSLQRMFTPPKTPAPRLPTGFDMEGDSPANEWSLIADSRDKLRPTFERSGSVCSSFSDSSVSSYGSSGFSLPTATGSCTSPESDATDPFLEEDLTKGDKLDLSLDYESYPHNKRVKTHRDVKWTPAMDDHIWITFLSYLSDPRVTPFKMLAGTAPPLGVCFRVANKAKRTWSGRRASTSVDLLASDRLQREDSPDTIRPGTSNAKNPQWPRSDGATRRRLR
ncbi:hypothetical protein BAUCODRAFT_55907, partial [Baudoinia panamericana UAMH 10762]